MLLGPAKQISGGQQEEGHGLVHHIQREIHQTYLLHHYQKNFKEGVSKKNSKGDLEGYFKGSSTGSLRGLFQSLRQKEEDFRSCG